MLLHAHYVRPHAILTNEVCSIVKKKKLIRKHEQKIELCSIYPFMLGKVDSAMSVELWPHVDDVDTVDSLF